jgi:Alginate export
VTRLPHLAAPLLGLRAAMLVVAASLVWHGAARADDPPTDPAGDDAPHLKISGSQRTRYERLDPQFRKGFDDSDQVVALQTSVLFDWSLDAFQFVGEIMDSRGELNDDGSFVTGTVNTLEPIQAYLAWHKKDMFEDGGDSTLRVGRLTLDLGKRRLIARNRYRNTVNNFLGADWTWRGSDGSNLRLFYILPMMAEPSDTASQVDNEIGLDHTIRDTRVIGAYYQLPPFADKTVVETYLLDYDVNPPGNNLASSAHWTAAGARAYRTAKPGAWTYETEGVWEWGRAGGTVNGIPRSNLEQNAYLVHLEAGYTFDVRSRPTLLVQYDYASGDKDPNDTTIERFGALFGARRFDYGPTGIYGAISRSNIDTPGVRLTFAPKPRWQSMFAYRWLFLAEARDQWVGSGWSDPTGQSGRTIGKQLEGSFTWTAIENRLAVEPGFAHLELGRFAHQVQGAAFRGDPLYFYLAVTTTF